MSPTLVIGLLLAYFAVLIGISRLTGRHDDNSTFFLGNRTSPWYVVAFGMIGASLSGVTFISVPGWVEGSQLSYMQMVLGYLVGYAVIAQILLPLYYRLQLTSIYTYLDQRFGFWSYKTGAFFFLVSRIIGAALRLFVVATVLQIALFDAYNVPFEVTVIVTIVLIWIYTFRSGIKTIIWTDTLQTAFMLLAVAVTLILLAKHWNYGFGELISAVDSDPNSRIFFFDDWKDSRHFVKRFLAGAFITIVMTGLDQDMMQKNLSCRSLADAQKNMYWFSAILVFVNLMFLSLGVLLYQFAAELGVEATGDELFPTIATSGTLGLTVGIFFLLGLIAAAYSSADSALTSLTTSFSVDFLNIDEYPAERQPKTRKMVHVGFSVILVIVILIFKQINDQSVIAAVFTAAGYTYGPLLGLYAFGLFTKRSVRDKWVPAVATASPVLCYALNATATDWFGFAFGFELLIINGGLTFLGLLGLSNRVKKNYETNFIPLRRFRPRGRMRN